MINKRQKTRTVILIIILVVAIIAGVFGACYYMNGYTSPFDILSAEDEEEVEEVVEEPTLIIEEPEVEEETEEEAQTEEVEEEIEEETTEPLLSGYGYFGALSVEDGRLVDSDGDTVILAGVSSHGLSWYPEYVSADSIAYLKNYYGINVVRLAVYTSDYNGYCVGGEDIQSSIKDTIDEAVCAAVDNDMYIIIDWHILNDSNPNTYKAEAIQFFGEMVRLYSDIDNVIYEICNEPNGDTTWDDIKSYANEVIPVIRNVDSDAVILVGTPSYCSDLESVMADPLDFDNIMYTYHFYTTSHTVKARNHLMEALDEGLPVFISEFGLSEASGDGRLDTKEASNWLELMYEYELSGCVWSLCNKDETSSLISADCDKTTDYVYDDLSTSGKWLYDYMIEGDSSSEE